MMTVSCVLGRVLILKMVIKMR